jgi:hypothetical protein
MFKKLLLGLAGVLPVCLLYLSCTNSGNVVSVESTYILTAATSTNLALEILGSD